jgi:6-phosphogluconolactonase (cycloisomerase 2 family)
VSPAVADRVALWVGAYTADMDGGGEGIVALGIGQDGAYEVLGSATAIESPSFLALHPSQPVLYAVSEGTERVHAFRYDEGNGELSALGPAGVASSLVCHVAVDPDGAFLVASCWGDGSVLVFELEPDGSLSRRHQGIASEDPYGQGRQSRAHSCLMLGEGRMVTAEMGHDLIRRWRFTRRDGLESLGAIELPRGSGPRHFAQTAEGVVYLNTEYTSEVAVLAPVAGDPMLALRGMFPVSTGGHQPDDAAAEICLDPSGQHLYVGVRGSNRICRLTLGDDGLPAPLDEFPCGGDWPRHHCIDGDRLLVALQRSDAIAVFKLGPDGRVEQPPARLSTGSPTCLLPQR